MSTTPTVGDLLRTWRSRRRMSQLDLACEAEVSSKHLSFVETGRAQPSREMLLRLAEHLEIPLRERNSLLLAAGYAPSFPERPLEDGAMRAAHKAVRMVLAGHEPYPALAIDRHWNLVDANRALQLLVRGADPSLLTPPINVLRLSLHPAGIAPRIANLAEWRAHLLARLRHQIALTADPALAALLRELQGYPHPAHQAHAPDPYAIVIPLHIQLGDRQLSFFSTTTVFGTPVDVTLAEIAIESFFPADRETAAAMQEIVGRIQSGEAV